MKRTKALTLAACLIFLGFAMGAHAQVGPLDAGPPDAVSGFPVTIGDGVDVLELCLDPVNCIFDPPIAGNQLSQDVGFGAEAAWWSADASIDLPGGGLALYSASVVASWLNGVPAAGEALPATNIVIRMDAPVAGTYTFTHPFGVETFDVVTPGQRAVDIALTFEFPNVFNAQVTGIVGPFLTAVNPPPPAGFLGNPNVTQTVAGSPFGTDLFSIEGPVGSDLGGVGIDTVQTDLFAVQGQILAVVTPMTATPATVALVSGAQDSVTIAGGQGGLTATSSNTAVATAAVSGRTVVIQGGTTGGTATITVSDSLVPANTAIITATTTAATVVGQASGPTIQTLLPTEQVSLLLNITPRAGTTPAQIVQEWLVLASFGPSTVIPNGIFFLTSAGTVVPLETANPGSATFTFDHALDTHFIANLSMGDIGLVPGNILLYGYAYSTTAVTNFANAPNLVLDNFVSINVQ